MGLFQSKVNISETKCSKCGMEFSTSERMMRHMIKAHKRKKFECNSCGFRN